MSELQDLIEAAAATPQSSAVLRAVLRAAGAAVDPAPALEYFAAADPASHESATQIAVGQFLFDHDRTAAVLPGAAGDSGPAALLRARAQLALGRTAEARQSYEAALARDAGLRSEDLDAALVARAGQTSSGTVVQLRPHLRTVDGA